jgi:hypothetical protein
MPPTAQTSGSVSTQFTAAGLASLKWNGTEMLASGVPTIGWICLIQSDGAWTNASTSPT